MLIPSGLHDELAEIGAAWLKRYGLAVVATNLTALQCRARADVIGFRSHFAKGEQCQRR
jgi:hypothetical protein